MDEWSALSSFTWKIHSRRACTKTMLTILAASPHHAAFRRLLVAIDDIWLRFQPSVKSQSGLTLSSRAILLQYKWVHLYTSPLKSTKKLQVRTMKKVARNGPLSSKKWRGLTLPPLEKICFIPMSRSHCAHNARPTQGRQKN
eukprot:scaffold5690_cov82-Cylindrotheca_fusiformis.AAC.1